MSPVVDGQVKVGGEIYLYPEFWKKVEETIYSSLFFDKLEQSLEGAEELPWYDIREYKLDEARTDKLITEFPGRGDCLRVLEYTSGASASIKFDSPTSPSFTLPTYEKIRWGFNKLYLTNTAQSGKKIEILFAKGDFDLKKAIQPIEPFGELANENLAVLTDWSKIADELIIARHIAAHVIDANKLNVATHILSGATWSNNSPVAGSIAWSGAKVTYNGATYTITNGNTDKAYIWWDFSLSTTTFQTSDTKPTLADDDFIAVYNDSGTHILIWNATIIDGRVIRTGSIIANDILLSGATTLADWRHPSDLTLIAGGQIFTHSIEADKLNIVRHILSGAVWADDDPVPGKISWADAEVTYNGHTYSITDGNTDKAYIWWDFSLSPTTFQTSDTKPTLTDDDFIVAYNDSGTHILIWNATLIDGRTIRTGSIYTDELAALAVIASKLNVVGIDATGRIIVADVTDADEITAGINNYASTLILPGKIIISGATNLADWRHASNFTLIDGGNVFANSITAVQAQFDDLINVSNKMTLASGRVIIDKDAFGANLPGFIINDGTYNRLEGGELSSGVYGVNIRNSAGVLYTSLGRHQQILEKVYDEYLTQNATSVTITGLNGDVDLFYFIHVVFINQSTEGGGYNFWMRCGTSGGIDAGNNYGRKYIVVDGANNVLGGAFAAISHWYMGDGDTINHVCSTYQHMEAKSGKERTTVGTSGIDAAGSAVTQMGILNQVWSNTAGNITQIQIGAGKALGMKIGTHISIYKIPTWA